MPPPDALPVPARARAHCSVPLTTRRLLLAGRCIIGSFIAHSSYRVTGDAVALGEAAGAAAALAATTRRLPQDVPWPEIQKAIAGGA